MSEAALLERERYLGAAKQGRSREPPRGLPIGNENPAPSQPSLPPRQCGVLCHSPEGVSLVLGPCPGWRHCHSLSVVFGRETVMFVSKFAASQACVSPGPLPDLCTFCWGSFWLCGLRCQVGAFFSPATRTQKLKRKSNHHSALRSEVLNLLLPPPLSYTCLLPNLPSFHLFFTGNTRNSLLELFLTIKIFSDKK